MRRRQSVSMLSRDPSIDDLAECTDITEEAMVDLDTAASKHGADTLVLGQADNTQQSETKDCRPQMIINLPDGSTKQINHPIMRKVKQNKVASMKIDTPMKVDKDKVPKDKKLESKKAPSSVRFKTHDTIASDFRYAVENISLEAACAVCLNTIVHSDEQYSVHMISDSHRMDRIYDRANYLLLGDNLSKDYKYSSIDDEIKYFAALMEVLDNLQIRYKVERNITDEDQVTNLMAEISLGDNGDVCGDIIVTHNISNHYDEDMEMCRAYKKHRSV